MIQGVAEEVEMGDGRVEGQVTRYLHRPT